MTSTEIAKSPGSTAQPGEGATSASNMVAAVEPTALPGTPRYREEQRLRLAEELASKQRLQSTTTARFQTPPTSNYQGGDYEPFVDHQGPKAAPSQGSTSNFPAPAGQHFDPTTSIIFQTMMASMMDQVNEKINAAKTTAPEVKSGPTTSQKAVHSEVKQRFDDTSKFDGAVISSLNATAGRQGPALHEWELAVFIAMLRHLDLAEAALGNDYHPETQRLAAFAMMEALSVRMKTAIYRQPHLTTNAAALWTYLQATYAPRGIAGLLYAMQECAKAKPRGKITPDSARDYIEHCRSLWLLSSKQICPTMSWGQKLEMILRVLQADWCSTFKFGLTKQSSSRS